MGCAEWFGEYVYQFWSINSKNCEIYEHLTENIVAGVSKLCSTTVETPKKFGHFDTDTVPADIDHTLLTKFSDKCSSISQFLELILQNWYSYSPSHFEQSI